MPISTTGRPERPNGCGDSDTPAPHPRCRSRRLEDLNARTGVETLFTDGGYGRAQNDEFLAAHQVTLLQTAIRGRPQDPERLHLEDFQVQMNASNEPEQRTCPQGKTGQVQASSAGAGWIAVVGAGCATCDVQHRCPVATKKRVGTWALPFKRKNLQRAERRRRLRQHQESGRNLRAAVECTIRSITHGVAGGTALARGLFRIPWMVGGAAAAVTMRRLHRVWQDTMRDPQGDASKKGAERTHQKGSATERCAYGFFASSNWVVTMAPAGLTTPSTPSLRLVTLAFCRGVNNKIWCEGLPFCSGLNNLLEGFRSSRCTLPGVRTVSQAARQALVW